MARGTRHGRQALAGDARCRDTCPSVARYGSTPYAARKVRMGEPRQRFSGRAENYARYRPGYPPGVLSFLEEECGLMDRWTVADVGAGTGILSGLFLSNGNRVFGVEPNAEMRGVAERLLGGHERFESVAGSAEATTLGNESVDLIAAGQVFHWFDPVASRAEFLRVLKPGGRVALVWNVRRGSGTPFLEAYEALLAEHGTDDGGRARIEGTVDAFFGAGRYYYAEANLPNSQRLDLRGFKGRLLSSSRVPAEDEPGSAAMLRDLKRIFRAHESGGEVTIEYDTLVYCGRPR